MSKFNAIFATSSQLAEVASIASNLAWGFRIVQKSSNFYPPLISRIERTTFGAHSSFQQQGNVVQAYETFLFFFKQDQMKQIRLS